MANKMTVVEKFGMVKAFLEENGASEDMVAFIQERADLQAKKSGGAKKPTKNQLENETYKDEILTILSNGDGVTATEIMKSMAEDFAIQKVTALLTSLRKEGKVTSEKDGKTTLFYLASEEESEED